VSRLWVVAFDILSMFIVAESQASPGLALITGDG
jgi:hypothetical protein